MEADDMATKTVAAQIGIDLTGITRAAHSDARTWCKNRRTAGKVPSRYDLMLYYYVARDGGQFDRPARDCNDEALRAYSDAFFDELFAAGNGSIEQANALAAKAVRS